MSLFNNHQAYEAQTPQGDESCTAVSTWHWKLDCLCICKILSPVSLTVRALFFLFSCPRADSLIFGILCVQTWMKASGDGETGAKTLLSVCTDTDLQCLWLLSLQCPLLWRQFAIHISWAPYSHQRSCLITQLLEGKVTLSVAAAHWSHSSFEAWALVGYGNFV